MLASVGWLASRALAADATQPDQTRILRLSESATLRPTSISVAGSGTAAGLGA